MSASLESTTAMNPQQGPNAASEPSTATELSVASVARDPAGVEARSIGTHGDRRAGVSPTVMVTVFGGIVAALLSALAVVMMMQFAAINARFDAMNEQFAVMNGRIDTLASELRAEIGDLGSELRAEMQTGFREIHVILRDHTDRLARLEAHVGLSVRD